MPNDPSVPYFDLSYARSLSRRLRAAAPPIVPAVTSSELPVEGPRFTRFPRGEPPTPRAPFDAAALGESLRGLHDAWGPSAWHALLDGCLQASGGSGAFALDTQGLVIATRGDVEPALAERLGARLSLTLDQAARMERGSGVVCVELESRWLTGLRAQGTGAGPITFGILASEPLALHARSAIGALVNVLGA